MADGGGGSGGAQVPYEWPTSRSSYEFIGKIGQGAFATVWKAKTISTSMGSDETESRECAVKVLNLDHVDTNLSEIRMEVQAMRLSLHPNVLTCHTAFVNDTHLWLVTPLMRKGSSLHCLQTARRVIKQQQPQQQTRMEDHILYIFHETLLGLQYIHENGQIHRDIKAGNILLDSNGDVRIADFGVSGWLVQSGSQQEKAKTFVGTPCWMAPEVMEQVHGYDYKADIWSLAITALELAKGYAPYAKYPPMKVLILTIQEDPPSLDSYDMEDDDDIDEVEEEFSKNFRSLIATCLQKNPAKRPTTQELLASKYMNSMNDPETRRAKQEAIRTQVCDLVRDVGTKGDNTSSSSNHRPMPGTTPISIILLQGEKDRPAGTTWVFADGSQVLSSSATGGDETVDDVLAELDEFERQTGGEHYSRSQQEMEDEAAAAEAAYEQQQRQQEEKQQHDAEDDLNAFMDEFEMNTAGEDFQHPSKRIDG